MNYSPLRYPGGKTKLYPLVKEMIENLKNINTYIEPFVGGGGLALSLLFNNVVEYIIINDYDKAIYSMWRAILTQTKQFIKLIRETPITIEEWKKQKDIYENNNCKYSLRLGFATFFLNRTNRSGILKAGPIGGYSQSGKYKIDCRFNKEDLIDKILKIASYKEKIKLYNLDARIFIKNIIPMISSSFTYFDPPYFNKGEELYTNFFNLSDHEELSILIKNNTSNWLVTYDDCEEVRKLYSDYRINKYVINYSVANTGASEELIFTSSKTLWPSKKELDKLKIKIIFTEEDK